MIIVAWIIPTRWYGRSFNMVWPNVIFVAGNATYNSPCRSVGPSVGPSVPLYFFSVFELFEGRIARVLVSCGCLCPCPTHYCPCPTHYCPCPTARDRGSRVYGLVLILTNRFSKLYVLVNWNGEIKDAGYTNVFYFFCKLYYNWIQPKGGGEMT